MRGLRIGRQTTSTHPIPRIAARPRNWAIRLGWACAACFCAVATGNCSGATAVDAPATALASPAAVTMPVASAAIANDTACADDAGWDDPSPPRRIHGDTWYVGTCGIAALLVASPQGHVLIDAGTATAAPQVLANLRALGVDPRDIRRILVSHEHLDHAGGLAALQAATGAPVVASAVAARVLRTGEADGDDPQHGLFPAMAPVADVREVDAGDTVRVGALRFTPLPMPGHTMGGLGWQWRSCERGDCITLTYADSMSAVSADDYRFSDHPDWIATLRATIARVESMPCDVLLTPHPSASALWQRLGPGASRPLRDPAACRRYAEAARLRLDNRLAAEARATGTMP